MAEKPVSYDAAVIQESAQRLYSQAASIIFTSTFWGVVIGALLGLGLGGTAAAQAHGAIGMAALIGAVIGAVIGGLVGYSRGKERAFKIKLEAQVALCQVRIEKNTHAEHS